MKVCLINNKFGINEAGGAGGVVLSLARGLRQAGQEVFVISLSDGHAGAQSEEGIKIYRIKPWIIFSFEKLEDFGSVNSLGLGGFLRLFWHAIDMFNLSANRQVKRILEQEKPDIVNTHNLKGLSYLIPDLLRTMVIPHVHTLHDLQLIYPSGILIKNEEGSRVNKIFLRRWYEIICRKLFGSPGLVIAPSKFLLEYYQKRNFFWDSESIVLPNPVDTKAGNGARKFEEEIMRIAPKKNIKLLFVGKLVEHKGIYFLITAFKRVQQRHKNLNLTLEVAGSGGNFSNIVEAAQGVAGINFLGQVTPGKMPDVYRSAHLTIVPSLTYENSPMVVYESLGWGTPVLASDIGGVGELIKEGYNGWFFQPGDHISFAKKLKQILANRNKNLGKYTAQNAIKSVKQYSAGQYVKQFLGLVAKINP